MAVAETIELSETLGCVNRLPPPIRPESAEAKVSMPLAISASDEIFAVLRSSRCLIAASFGARSAAVRLSTRLLMSIPEPTPRVDAIEPTMRFPFGHDNGRGAIFLRAAHQFLHRGAVDPSMRLEQPPAVGEQAAGNGLGHVLGNEAGGARLDLGGDRVEPRLDLGVEPAIGPRQGIARCPR